MALQLEATSSILQLDEKESTCMTHMNTCNNLQTTEGLKLSISPEDDPPPSHTKVVTIMVLHAAAALAVATSPEMNI
jgi:hypothetical protein